MSSRKTEEAVCAHCRLKFFARASAIKIGKGKFCSLSCSISNRNINSKLATVDLFWSLDIRAQLNNGKTGYQLGKKYGVHHQTIYSIKYKHNWTSIADEYNRY